MATTVARSHAQAQWLVEQFLHALLTQPRMKSKLSLSTQGERWGRPVPRATWINVPMLRSDESVADAAARVAQARAFIEVVGQLSQAPALEWVDCYDAFWKPVLVTPLRLATRSSELRATAFDCLEQLKGTRAPKFMLDFTGDAASTGDCLALLEAFCDAQSDRVVSESQRSVLAALLNSTSVATTTTAPRIEVGIYLSNASASLSMLEKLPRVLKRIADVAAHVRLEVTTLWVPGRSMADARKIDALAALVASEKLAIRHVRVESLFFSSACVPLEAFQAFVYRTLSVKSLQSVEPRLETLVFERPAFTHRHVASICSALRSSQCLKEVTLAVQADAESNLAVVWAWIAFGILDPDADARLDRLCIGEIAVRDDDVAIVHRILTSSTPGKDIWELEHGDLPTGDGFELVAVPARMRVFVRVDVHAAIRVQPVSYCHVLVPDVLDTNVFEAVILLAAWTCIVVPGYGLGWIQTDAIVAQELTPQRRCSGDSIEWDAAAFTNVKVLDRPATNVGLRMTGIRQLLHLVGRNLEGLNLPCHRITADDLDDILAACPNLTWLNISGNQIDDLSPLVARYRARTCAISSLGFRSFDASTLAVSQLTELLTEPHAAPLWYLNVECPRPAAEVKALARAFQASRHCALRVLDLYASSFDGSDAIAESIRWAIERPRGAQMRSRTRTALLSVVCHKGEEVARAVKQLDAAILSIIFSFAATTVPRAFIWHGTS